MSDHSFVPVSTFDYECEFCGVDPYWDLDAASAPCTYSRLTTIPRVKRKQKPTSWLGKLINAIK